MKRAYEYDFELITGAIPVVLKEEEQTWEAAFETDEIKVQRFEVQRSL